MYSHPPNMQTRPPNMHLPQAPPTGPHGQSVYHMTGCEHLPSFTPSLSPAVMSINKPGVLNTDPITEDVILDGDVGKFQITRHGGFPTPTIKAVISSALRTRSRHPDPAEFGFGTCPGVKNLHALRLREISIPDSLPNVSRYNNRLYINTFFFDGDYNLVFQNFVTEVPVSNYLNVNHLLASIDNALDFLRYHPAGEGLEENHADQHAEWGSKYSQVRPPLSLSTTFDQKRNRVGIAAFGKLASRFEKDTTKISYLDGTTLTDVSVADIKFPTHTVRAEQTTSPGATEKISNVHIVDVSATKAIDSNIAGVSHLRFLEFEVSPGRHNLAVGDRVTIHDVSLADPIPSLALTTPEMFHVAYLRKGGLNNNDVIRTYLYTDTSTSVESTVVELGANPRIVIQDLAENNIGPLLGFRCHTRLGLGVDLEGGHDPFLNDEACVTPGAVELSRTDGGTKALTFKSTLQPLFPPQTYAKSKNSVIASSQTFLSDNVEDRSGNLAMIDASFGASVLVVNGDTTGTHALKAAEFFVPGVDSVSTELISSNVLRVPQSGSLDLNTVLADTSTAIADKDSHVYPQSWWGWKKDPESTTVRPNMSSWAVTFGTAMVNMSHLNQYVLVRVTRNGQQLGSIVTPQSRRTGHKYLAKLHFLRNLDGGTGRLFATATGGLHVFPNPVREDALTTSPNDGTPPDEMYTVELLDQTERRLDVSGDDWDFVLEYICFR